MVWMAVYCPLLRASPQPSGTAPVYGLGPSWCAESRALVVPAALDLTGPVFSVFLLLPAVHAEEGLAEPHDQAAWSP